MFMARGSFEADVGDEEDEEDDNTEAAGNIWDIKEPKWDHGAD